MDREHVVREIQRTAKANGGVALGWRRFEEETGIRYYDWYGQFWARWGDAVREAGFEPNRMSVAFDGEFLIEKLVVLTRRLGCVPTQGHLLLAAKGDPEFPSEKAFRRLGSKSQRASRIIAFCEAKSGYEDVAVFWRQVATAEPSADAEATGAAAVNVGYVYLLKHGSRREYKIGRTNNPVRREGEFGIQLPEKLQPVHYIETDDPAGVENYWHSRFADKRKEGEWFALSADDVRAFKRWKRICRPGCCRHEGESPSVAALGSRWDRHGRRNGVHGCATRIPEGQSKQRHEINHDKAQAENQFRQLFRTGQEIPAGFHQG